MMTSQWRLLLREYIATNPEEKKAIARKLDVSPRSIERWIANGSTTAPEPAKVFRLAQMIPNREQEMRLSLERDYPNAFERSNVEILSNIPSAFYARIAGTRATAAHNLNRPTNMSTVLRQIGSHLDPNEEGLLVLFVRCVSPLEPGGRITGLVVYPSGHGTGQWLHRQVERSYMIGTGTLCANALIRGDITLYPQDIADIDYASTPIVHGEDLHSCAAFPVLREGDVAGALFVGAKQEEFFTDARRTLLREYSYLFALALRDNEFYPIEQIDLQVMPSVAHQSEIFFRSQQFLESLAKKYPNETIEQLEQRARNIFQEYIEEEPTSAR